MTTHCPHCHKEVEPQDLEVRFKIPKGCICEPHDWGDPDNIPAICGEFIPFSDDEPELCMNCEHEKPCHDS